MEDKGKWYPQVTNFNKSEKTPKDQDKDKDSLQKRISDMDLMK